MQRALSEMTLTKILALPYSDVLLRIQSGEWGVEQLSQWAENKLDHAYGDGYDEGWNSSEENHSEA